jgi:signal transduction histidine kinase
MTRPWSSASVRLRLTAWYTAVLAVLLIAYAAATFVAVRHEFLESAEEQGPADVPEEDRIRAQLGEVLAVLALGFPVVVLFAALGGYVLARKTLAPIDASFDQLRRFTADASHELRTPLAVIRATGEAGLRDTRTPAAYKEMIGGMLEEVDRLSTLVETLLRLSYGDAGSVRLTREPIDLGQLVRDVVASLTILSEERRIRIEVRVTRAVSVSADRLVLREGLTNVIDNAIKYGPPESVIDVGIDAGRDEAVVTVADQGPGIAPEYRERIFDRFFRIDAARSRDNGGAGLGLAISKWAIEANGGRISVDAGRAGGAVFRIALPTMPAGERG